MSVSRRCVFRSAAVLLPFLLFAGALAAGAEGDSLAERVQRVWDALADGSIRLPPIERHSLEAAAEAHARLRLGTILELRKDAKGALAEYRMASRLDPALADAKAGVARLGG